MLGFALDARRFDPTLNSSMALSQTVEAQTILHGKLLPFRDIQFHELMLSFLNGYAETVSCTNACQIFADFRLTCTWLMLPTQFLFFGCFLSKKETGCFSSV